MNQADAISYILKEVELLQTEILLNEVFLFESEEKVKTAKSKNLFIAIVEAVRQRGVQIKLLNRLTSITSRLDTCERLLNKFGVDTKK
jgi:hypothetical protein